MRLMAMNNWPSLLMVKGKERELCIPVGTGMKKNWKERNCYKLLNSVSLRQSHLCTNIVNGISVCIYQTLYYDEAAL